MGCTLTTGWGGTFKKNVQKKTCHRARQNRRQENERRAATTFTCPCYNFATRWARKLDWEKNVLLGHFHSTPYLYLSFARGKLGWQGITKWAKTPFRNVVSDWHVASISPCSAFKLHNYTTSLKVWAVQTGRCLLTLCHQIHTQLQTTNERQKSLTVMTRALQEKCRTATKWKRFI